MIEQKVKTYKTQQQFRHDVQHMAHQGWQMQTSTVGGYRKASIFSWLMFGIFNIFRKSKARDITVTYTRQTSVGGSADVPVIAGSTMTLNTPETQAYLPRPLAWWIPALWILASIIVLVTQGSGIGVFLFIVGLGSACFLDWQGLVTLRGWLHPETMEQTTRRWYVVAWVLLSPIAFPAYAIRTLLQNLNTSQAITKE